MDSPNEPDEKYVFPFFSKKPILPNWRDLPWIGFVLIVLWYFHYIPLGMLEIFNRWTGLVIVGVGIGVAIGARAVLWCTYKIFPESKNNDRTTV